MADKKVLNRMNYLIGHLRAVAQMIEEDKYCIDIIRQNQAVICALKKINEIVLRGHLDSCVTTAIKGKSETERKRMFDEIISVFKEEGRG